MRVTECMSTPIRHVRAEQTVQEAAAAMREYDVAELAVQREGSVQGFITDRDIITCCAAEGADPTATTVEQFMRQDVARCREDTDLDAAAAMMEQTRSRHLLVVDARDRATGTLSLLDLARQLIRDKPIREVLDRLCAAR